METQVCSCFVFSLLSHCSAHVLSLIPHFHLCAHILSHSLRSLTRNVTRLLSRRTIRRQENQGRRQENNTRLVSSTVDRIFGTVLVLQICDIRPLVKNAESLVKLSYRVLGLTLTNSVRHKQRHEKHPFRPFL
jgi:hypothetical protein